MLKNVSDCVEDFVLCACDHHSNALLAYVAERTHTALQHFVWSDFGGKVLATGFQNIALKCMVCFQTRCVTSTISLVAQGM